MKKVQLKNDIKIYSDSDVRSDVDLVVSGYKMYILGVRVDFGMTLGGCVRHIVSTIEKNRTNSATYLVCTTNPEFIVTAGNDKLFKQIINHSYLSVPDGGGVILAKKFIQAVSGISNPIVIFIKGLLVGIISFFDRHMMHESISGIDLFADLMKVSADCNYSVFLLGGRIKGVKSVSENVVRVLQKQYPSINIIGHSSDFSFDAGDDAATIAYIHGCMQKHNVSKLDIIAVAYGQGKQEKWIERNATKIPVTIALGLGGTLDYMGGCVKRAPKLLRQLGLEWLFRLFIQPRRILRVLNAFPIFPFKVFLSVLSHDKE